LSVLRDWGVDVIFTCPGSTEGGFLDASLAYPELRLILTTHESIAVAAADGYARVTGRAAVAYLHTNVGLANGVGHLYCAKLARSPVILLNGTKSTAISNRDGFTTAPHMRDHVRQYVLWDRMVLRAEDAADDLVRALKIATAEPGGPVYLGLPQDLLEGPVAPVVPDVRRRKVTGERRPAAAAVAEAARSLAAGRAVLILAGSDIARTGARDAVLDLARRLDAPVILEDRRSIEALGILASDPRFVGFYSLEHPAVRACDVLFLAGTASIMEAEPPREPALPAGAVILHLCSDPAEIAKVNPCDVPLTGHARLALEDIIAALPPPEAAKLAARQTYQRDARAAYVAGAQRKHAAAAADAAHDPIVPPALMHALAAALPDDCTVVGDSTTAAIDLMDLVIAGSSREYFKTSGGSLGWGMGAAVGMKLAQPERDIVCVIGDGVFQFGIQALWTAVSHRLRILFLIVDNASYAAVKAAIVRFRRGDASGPFPASDISGPNYAGIAQNFGAFGVTVRDLNDLPAALRAARAHDGPSVVSVSTDPQYTDPAYLRVAAPATH
jgi:thiamine pyrophosphate-dependent acetolactate synthase large subunit-like protein